MNTLFGTIFKAFHCFIPLMNRYYLQFCCQRHLDFPNTFLMVAFQFHFQFGRHKVVQRTQIGREHRKTKHWNYFFCQELRHNCRVVCQCIVVEEIENLILLYLWPHTCTLLQQTTQNLQVKFFLTIWPSGTNSLCTTPLLLKNRISKEVWKGKNSPKLQKFGLQASKVKRMIMGYDYTGVIATYIVPYGHTVDQHMYIHFLHKMLKPKVRQMHLQMVDRVIILHGNIHPHIATLVSTVFQKYGWEVLNH